MQARTIDTEFYLAPGGPIDRLQQRLWAARATPARLVPRAVLTALVIWLPLLVFSLIEPNADADISFLHDIAVHVRFLLIGPLLIMAENSIGQRSRLIVMQFLTSGLVGDADAARFETAVRRGRRLLDSWIAEFLIVVLSVTLVWISTRVVMAESTVFWFERITTDGPVLTRAGWWYSAIARPVFLYLVLRWVWRCLLWWWFLGRVARLDLHLTGTHPDRMGGLGFVTFHHAMFALLAFVTGCAVSAAVANRILYADATLMSYRVPLIGIIAGTALVGVAPLLVFTPHLVRAKRMYWMSYSRFASDYVWMFQEKWMGKKSPDEAVLGTGDIQSLADLGGSFERLVGMKPVAVDRRIVMIFVLATAAPVLPLLLTVMPLGDIIKMLVKALM